MGPLLCRGARRRPWQPPASADRQGPSDRSARLGEAVAAGRNPRSPRRGGLRRVFVGCSLVEPPVSQPRFSQVDRQWRWL